jgi:hypothetical protein
VGTPFRALACPAGCGGRFLLSVSQLTRDLRTIQILERWIVAVPAGGLACPRVGVARPRSPFPAPEPVTFWTVAVAFTEDGRHRRHHLGRPDHAAPDARRPPQPRHIVSADRLGELGTASRRNRNLNLDTIAAARPAGGNLQVLA